MDVVIAFTLAQLIGVILAICAGISSVCVAAGWVYKGIKKVREPNVKQDERLFALEKRVSQHEEFFGNDNRRIESLEEGNRVTQQALLALLGHGIDGNNTEQMQSAKDSLQKYLIER